MSEIDGKSSELSFLSSFFADQESCSVAAAISSALETAAEDHSHLSSHHNNNQHHHPHQQDPNQHFFQQPYNNHQQYNQINYTTDNNNHHCFRFGDLVKTNTGESLVNNFGQQQHHQQQHQQEPIYHPVAPFYDQSHHHQQQYENHYHQQHTHNINTNNHQPTLLSCNTNNSIGSAVVGGGGSGRNGSTNKSTAEGNHVSGGDTFTISRSSCSQQFNQQQNIPTLSSQMADKQDYNSSPTSDKTTSSPVRDKSDNRETYQVSHCKEKPTCDKREVDSGGGGGSRGVFKPSSKIIDLPEKSTSSTHDHHHHHHHHSSSRSKDSKIPVGIAVAWQRLVTTSSSSPGNTSTMTTKAGEGVGGKGKVAGASCNINIPSKYPSRPSSATSLKSSTVKQNQQNNNNSNLFSSSNGYSSASNPNLSIGENTSDILSSRPMSACGDAVLGAMGGVSYCPSPAASPVLSRPLPSSSVPPNIGYPTGSYHPSSYPTHHNPYNSPHHPHHRQAGMSPYLDYPYGVAAAAAAQRGFAVPSPLTSQHHHHSHPNLHPSYWGMDAPPPVPLLSPGISSSPSGVASPADYLQQLSSLQQQHHQQQMHLHHSPQNPHHPLHQQHLLASAAAAAANRQISSSPSPSSPYGPAPTTNQYLQFLYPPTSSSSSSQEATSLAVSVAAAMNKSPYYDHYFLQHQNLLQQQQQHQQNQASVNSSCNNTINTNNSVTTSGAFDLLANNNNSSSGSSQQHRAIPMQVASPINRTTTPQLSSSPTVSGEIRTPTPTKKSSSSSSVNLAATTTVAVAKAASSSTSDAAPVGCITSSVGGSDSAASTFSLATSTTTTAISFSPSSTTSTSQNFLGSSQSSSAGAPPPTISSSSRPQQESCPSPSSLFLLHHQQQHPHLFTTSSAALSPKSLTSSTPSPVTVHDFNSGLNVIISSNSVANNTVTCNNNMAAATRKGATPSPVSLTPTRALLSPFPPGSPFCPSPIPSNNNNNGGYKELHLWKDDSSSVSKIKPIPINGQTRETHVRNSGSRHASGGSSLTTPPPLCSPLLSIAHHNNMKNNKVISVSTPMSSPSGGQKHDFKRLESLIERRDSESISPLVLYPQHSPATSTTSSVVDPDETYQQIGRPLEQEQEMCIRRDDDEDEMGTFRVSVKLEKAEPQVHQRDDEREVDESFKVKPTTTSKLSEMIKRTDHEDGHADQKAEGICMAESDGENMEKVAAVKVEFLSPVIRSCDDPTNPRNRQDTVQENNDSKTQSNEIVEGNDVPESTLPLLCSMSRSISNYDNSFTDDDDNDKRNNKKASNLTTIKDNKHHQQQTVKDKDVSFTSGYSSSHEDNNDNTFIIEKQPTTVTGKQKKPKKVKGEQQMPPSLKLPSYKINNQKKDKKNSGGGKSNKNEKKEKAPKKTKEVVTSLEKPVKSKKTLKVCSEVSKKVNKKKGKAQEDGLASNLDEKTVKKKYTRKNSETDAADKQSETKKKIAPKKGKTVVEERVVVPKKNKGGNKGVKQTKMGEQGSTNSQQQSWAPTSSSGMTNYQQHQQQFVNSSDNRSGNYFVSPNVTIAGGSSGDISCTVSSNANPDQSNASLTSNPIQPPPMAVLLHHQIHQATSSAASTALHSPPTQVTFLITSPDRTVSGATSPLRIPAYIPRSGTTTSTTTNAAVEDLVGEGYNGPATLTLHRDVDAAAVVCPQSSYYSHLPNHPPPAITIQYHHSAPSTPLTMEAASPSSLDLLATVAQEFGSREDLGKRHSIDGGSSCNTSILGESPPMSPQKSPASYHHPPPSHHPNHFPHNFSSTIATTTVPPLHVTPTTSQKSVPPPAPIVVPPPPPKPLLTSVSFGKRPKSPKKTQTKPPRKSPSKQQKTSNSITLKQTSKKVKKIVKAGKKEKRTVSDSAAALYTPPVVYLKIPQVPGLCPKKKGTALIAPQEKAASMAKKNKTKVKSEMGLPPSNKSKQINNTNKEKPALLKLNKNAIPKDVDNIDNLKKKKNNKTKEDKAEKKAASKKSSPLLTNLPTSGSDVGTACKAEKEKEPKRSSIKTTTTKKEKKNKLALVEGGIISTLSPLNTTTISSTPLAFSKDHLQITGNLTTATTPSPTKEKPSSFYNPPERISAFAKQVISRRSSTVGSGSVSPTKPSINNNGSITTSSSVFFPTQQQKQPLLPNSPTIKMPQLTPYDALSPPTPTSPDSSNTTAVATASIIPLSSTSSNSRDRDSSPTFSTVPKVVNLMRFPPPSSMNSSGSSSNHLPPPLLLPSVDCKDKKDYCDDVNDNDVEDARRISMISKQAEQAKKKTDRHRSPINSNKISVKGKKRKDNGQLLEAEDEPLKKKKKRRRRLSSSQDGDDNDDHPTSKKDKPKKKKKDKSESLPKSKKVPKITFTTTHSTTISTRDTTAGGPSSSLAFSPLTPPLTAKFSSSSLEGDEIGKEPRKSAFASLQVPHSGSTTPCSSLHSCKSSSPSCCVNVEDSGETETENENDFNNVWVADPMFAVSAIKVSTLSSPVSNQPTDGEEDLEVEDSVQEEEDDNDDDANAVIKLHKNKKVVGKVGGSFNKKGSKPPKLSLPVQQQKTLDRENILDVNSQFSKAFVHFKPKQLTSSSNKKGNHGSIKPCLKAEPIIVHKSSRSVEENDDLVAVENDGDDDEDFQLDMEVANITTKNNNRNQSQNAPKKVEKAATSSTTSAATATASTATNKKNKPSINRNSSSYLVKHQSLSTKEIMTKVFSRKLSPDLNERKSKMKRRRSSAGMGGGGGAGTEMDADDEDDEEEELLDIETPSSSFIFSNKSSHQSSSNNPHISMSAAAQAVIVNSGTNQSSASSTPALSSSSLALLSSSPMKKPKKRSARSSTTSSCASTKSSSQRGNRGQSSGSGGVSASYSSSTSTMTRAAASASSSAAAASQQASKDEIQAPGKVELDSVGELVDEMRILTDIQGLFYTGRLNALQPPDVYGVTLDNERGAPPHLIFSAEEVLEKCLREKKPQNDGLRSGLRICAYWSPQYSGLYPGRVSTDFSPKFDPEKDLIPIEFDDGDTGMIKLKEIRLLSVNHPVREYDPNPLLTLEKKHRKRRHSSATGTSGGCTGDHEEPDCGEPYCAKIGKLEEDDEDDDGDNDDDEAGGGRSGGGMQHHSKMLYWTWSGLGYKRPKSKKNRNKEFFHGIQRGNEVINVGDAALFISTGNERPFIGRVERFWESKGKKMVNVRWFYHPEEVKASAKRLSNLKYPGALFESPHIDENDVQTIAKKCDVLPFPEFKHRLSGTSAGSLRPAKLSMKSSSKPRDMYYVAGYYDPYTYNLTLKDLK